MNILTSIVAYIMGPVERAFILWSWGKASPKFDVLPKLMTKSSVQFSHCHVGLFATPWIAAHQASLSITISQSLPKVMFIELVMASNFLTLYCSFLFLPSIFPRIRVFSSESVLCIRLIGKNLDAGKDLILFSYSEKPQQENNSNLIFLD